MYMAKANGKSGFAIFDPGMHEAMRERHELSVDLQRAVDLDQLTLLYQPIMDLRTGRIAGVEGLLRWHHPTHGLVMPGRFIEIAEESGAILPIGHWVLRQACREVAGWIEDGTAPADMSVSVNVSAREIQQLGFLDSVKAVLAESGLDPTRLMLEITETALLRATPSTIATLNGVRALGVRTVIDDFGTGYFSLSHLRQFPIDTLKIASEFVQDTDAASKSSALAGAIVAMSRSLDIETVAEGIETQEQADRMRDLGCAFGQGFAFAHPLTGDDLLATFGTAAAGADKPSTVKSARHHEPPSAPAAKAVRRRLRSWPARRPRPRSPSPDLTVRRDRGSVAGRSRRIAWMPSANQPSRKQPIPRAARAADVHRDPDERQRTSRRRSAPPPRATGPPCGRSRSRRGPIPRSPVMTPSNASPK